jgi:Zn-dependent peptidase ImmA (M78 family)
VKVNVNSEVLGWAVERSGKSVDELLPRFPRIREWTRGETQPTLRQLESLAKATMTPLGFLFLQTPPAVQLPIPYFRTVHDDGVDEPSPNLIETIYTMQRRQDWMRDFVVDEGQEELGFVASAGLEDDPVDVARNMREVLGFDEFWAGGERTWEDALRVLRNRMEDVGILVMVNGVVGNNTHRKLDPTEFRGFVLVDNHAPLVFVNGADGKAAQMFTLAHELAHVFFGSSAAFDLRQMLPAADQTERACNLVAAEFLVPGSRLLKAWRDAKEERDPFQKLAREFKVSAIVVARRVLDLSLIGREAFFEFYRNYMAEERRRSARSQVGGDFYATQNARIGNRFGATIVRAAQEGRLLYSDAFALTGLNGKAFERFAAGIVEGGG